MAIVNRTPDSFFDRGATYAQDAALRAVERAVTEGAEIIDIGGVKAGPGVPVDPAEEIRRTVSTIARIRTEFPDVVISIDRWAVATYPAAPGRLRRRGDRCDRYRHPARRSRGRAGGTPGRHPDRPGARLRQEHPALAGDHQAAGRTRQTRRALDMVAAIRGDRQPAVSRRGPA
jgi:hypothetical protein